MLLVYKLNLSRCVCVCDCCLFYFLTPVMCTILVSSFYICNFFFVLIFIDDKALGHS